MKVHPHPTLFSDVANESFSTVVVGVDSIKCSQFMSRMVCLLSPRIVPPHPPSPFMGLCGFAAFNSSHFVFLAVFSSSAPLTTFLRVLPLFCPSWKRWYESTQLGLFSLYQANPSEPTPIPDDTELIEDGELT